MSVEAAYAEVERLTRREARNFAYGIMVLPRPKRQAIAAIYAFARRVDDVADGALPLGEKQARLPQVARDALDAPPAETRCSWRSADARSRYPIPGDALHELVDGGLQDTEQTRYADFDGAARLLPPGRGSRGRRLRGGVRLRTRSGARRRSASPSS